MYHRRPVTDRTDDADSVLRGVAAAPAVRPPVAAQRLEPGQVVGERFVVSALVRDNEESARYDAIARESGGAVTLEVAHAAWADGEPDDSMARLSPLAHPAIARHLAHGVCADGSAFVATERLDGTTLSAYVAEHGVLSAAVCTLVARQIAEGLGAVHALGLVHGDLRPSNVIAVGGALDDLRLVGFAGARLHPRALTVAVATPGGERASYVAPEQARGVAVDARADLFALGCVLYECFTGAPPFTGATEAAVLTKLSMEGPPRLRTRRADTPAALDALVATLLERDREARPRDAAAVLDTLAGAADGLASTARHLGAIAPGTLLAGRYEIVRELGRGGMGRVFAARDRRLARDVAVKILLAERSDPHAFFRLEQEARAASRINHPNIATVHDVLATDHGPCIVSELLDGKTLRELLASGGARSVEETRKLGAQLAAGLAAAHERGVLHRDLKPANLFVTVDGRLKILDFGLAKLLEPDTDAPRTEEGQVLGTLGYMAPEQVRGEPTDARSDLFSAGIVLYEALTGQRPFQGVSRHEIESRIISDPPGPLAPNLPAALATTVLRCLEKDPTRRFQSARDLAAALEGTAWPSHTLARSSRPLASWLTAAAIVALVAAGAAVTMRAFQRRATAPAAATTAPQAPPSVAVLPFRDLGPDKNQEFLSDGIAEEILTTLARVDGLRVAGRTSSFSFRDTHDDARAIGQKLGVSALLEGSVRRAGDRMRISARLINAADGYQLWAQDFDRGTGDILAVEEELARAIAAALKVKLVSTGGVEATSRGWSDPQSYADYLLARRQIQSGVDPYEVLPLVERVLARNPRSAAAWALDADVLMEVNGTARVKTREETLRWIPRSLEAANKAIALDPDLPDGYVDRAALNSFTGDWDFESARADLDRALALAPNDPGALGLRGRLLLYFSPRVDEAIADLKRAIELDPLESWWWTMLGYAYRAQRRFDDMKTALSRAVEINSQARLAQSFLAEYELRTGSPEKALQMYAAIPGPDDSYRMLGEVQVLAALKRTAEARAVLSKLETKWPEYYTQIAQGYLALGDRDHFWSYCERALEKNHEHVLAELIISPFMDDVRRDPRYPAFVRRMHLLDAR
jgi:eukaryotic-like serine/threonine-protein kinase